MSKTITDPKKSAMHKRVVALIKELFPSFNVEEEKTVAVGDTKLFCDIAVKQLRLVIECHGRQHFEFVQHFHRSQENYAAAQRRDEQKKSTVENAGWFYMVVRHDEWEKLTRTQLAKKISKAMRN
jgi:very-short-patch-repair endonuclease